MLRDRRAMEELAEQQRLAELVRERGGLKEKSVKEQMKEKLKGGRWRR